MAAAGSEGAPLHAGGAGALESVVYGTTVARSPADALESLVVSLPDAEDPALPAAQALLERAWAAEREAERLVALRDALLPPLLDGRLTVRAAP